MPARPTVVDATTARPVRTRSAADPSWGEVRRPHWHVVRFVTALAWLLLAAAVLLTGERSTTLDSLLAAGDVGEVRVSGPGLPPGARGYAVEQVRWREGAVRYVAEIVEANPRRAGLRARTEADQRPVVTTDAVAYLDERTEGVRVVRDGSRTFSGELGPWLVPDWVRGSALLLLAATGLLLLGGPRPWRATRWAWFWLMLGAAPIGVPAFLVLSGPVPGLRRPRPGAVLLTGGWAFLLTFLFLKPLVAGPHG